MDNDSIQVRIMKDKCIKYNYFFRISKKEGDSIVWKEVINHRKYIRVGLKWCIGDGRKVCFQKDCWVYMLSLVSFVDENSFHCINWDAKMHDFINQDTKKWNLHSTSLFLPSPQIFQQILKQFISLPFLLRVGFFFRISLKMVSSSLSQQPGK